MVKDGQAKVKPADKMLMIPALFDGEKPEKTKAHYERFNQYIKFQTKEGNIKDTTKEAIELFEHTPDKKALIWFQQNKAEFPDLTTLKNMFLARYNPWEKTKRDQLQSCNNLSFDSQKTDIDEQIDLVSTLGNMVGQDEQTKMEKFIDTMPTITQTHLIIKPNWADVTKKAKNLEHIIWKCDPPAIAPPSLQGAGAVPSLYSHIAQSQDQDSDNIPKPFKSTKGRGGKKSGKGKQKSQQQPQPSHPPPEEEEHHEETNNYYHNENHRDNNRGCRPYRGQQGSGRKPYRGSQQREEASKIIIRGNTKATMGNLTPPTEAITTINIMVVIEAEVEMAMVVIITEVAAAGEAVIESITITDTTNITHMMMAYRWSNMAHHVHFAVVSITLLSIV